MEGARDLALQMEREGKGKVLNQFANEDNPLAHFHSTGPEIWRDTHGQITHFVSSMGTTGTIMGTGRFLKSKNPQVQIVGVQPATQTDQIPGIRRWTPAYLPEIFHRNEVDLEIDMSQPEAEQIMHRLAAEEGIFCGVSSGGAVAAALRLSATLQNATIVAIICDRGDRYISTGIFPA
jgi:cysteine synthase B